jgi:periplasmic divalent cation tolerance protein
MERDVALLLCTAPDDTIAHTLARGLVEARLAACVSILPGMKSTYRWKGAIEESTEAQLIVKTTRFRAQDAMAFVKAAHPYEVPEVLLLDVDDGADAYLEWVERETTPE